MVDAMLDEAAPFCRRDFVALNRVGDLHGCRLDGGRVVTAPVSDRPTAASSTAVGMVNGDPAYGGKDCRRAGLRLR